MKKTGVVILNYSTYLDTIKLVEALQMQSIAEEVYIVVVDNASPNESYEQLQPLATQYNNVVVLQTGENLGYAKGNNFGLEYLEKHVSPIYVAILNNDVILPNDSFEKLIERYEVLDKPALIAPIMTDINGACIIYNRININTFRQDFLSLFALYRVACRRNKVIKQTDDTGCNAMKADILSGSFLFSRFDVFKQMGYFYPNTFLYAEERFVAKAALELGLQSYLILDQTYIHAHNSPTISKFHSQVGKYKMLYTGIHEFARIKRTHGKLKAAIYKPFMHYSLWEMKMMERVKKMRNKIAT